ncbi:hypothetical protein Vafri_6983 [Volvox africanus]|uniref:Uncharacterized protein n=1 Tax=Volvox africanus TaxID=51714 RepID=A0A8J4EXE9_9CHLO|nr:hypothetical protein Vafri_6983 [Volvox africanus]
MDDTTTLNWHTHGCMQNVQIYFRHVKVNVLTTNQPPHCPLVRPHLLSTPAKDEVRTRPLVDVPGRQKAQHAVARLDCQEVAQVADLELVARLLDSCRTILYESTGHPTADECAGSHSPHSSTTKRRERTYSVQRRPALPAPSHRCAVQCTIVLPAARWRPEQHPQRHTP